MSRPELLGGLAGQRALVERVRAGDLAAFDELYLGLERWLLGILGRQFGDLRADVEDIAAEAWARAWRHLDRWQPTAPFSSWLLAISRRVALDVVRRRRFRLVGLEMVDLERSVASPEARAVARDGLRRAWQALSPAQRRLLVCWRLWGESGPCQARARRVRTSTLYDRRRAALERGRRELAVGA